MTPNNAPFITATSNSFLTEFIGAYFTNPSAKSKLVQLINASPTMRDLVARAAVGGVEIDVVSSSSQGHSAEVHPATSTRPARTNFDAALVAAAATGNAVNMGDFLLTLAHELGHLYGTNGFGDPAPIPVGSSQTPDQYARKRIFDEEGAATAYSAQVAIEVKRALPAELPTLSWAEAAAYGPNYPASVQIRGLEYGSLSNLMGQYPTQASLQAPAFEQALRQATLNYHIAHAGESDYYTNYVAIYVGTQMGLGACKDALISNVTVTTNSASLATTNAWKAKLRLGSVDYVYDASRPAQVELFVGGKSRGTKALLRTRVCQASEVANAPEETLAYFVAGDTGVGLLDLETGTQTSSSNSHVDIEAGTALAIDAPEEWLSYVVYSGDSPLSIKVSEGAAVQFDEELSGKDFSVRKEPGLGYVELSMQDGERVAVHLPAADFGSLRIGRPGLAELPLPLLLGTDSTAASLWKADQGGELRGFVDITNTLHGSTSADQLVGGTLADVLYGSLGNDTLDGGGGADKMYGGQDNDTYVVDSVGDETVELEGEGYDTVEVHRGALTDGTYVLQANIEKGVLLETALDGGLTGNGLNNTLVGNDFGNTLIGGTGTNYLSGGGGADSLYSSGVGDVLEGGLGDDYFELYGLGAQGSGGQGDDYFYDLGTGNVLDGGGGADNAFLVGTNAVVHLGAGADGLYNGGVGNQIFGGTGNDTFYNQGVAEFVWQAGDGYDYAEALNGGLATFTFDDANSTFKAKKVGSDLVVSSSAGGGVTFGNWFMGQNHAQIQMAGGAIWTAAELDAWLAPTYEYSYAAGIRPYSELAGVLQSLQVDTSGIPLAGFNRSDYVMPYVDNLDEFLAQIPLVPGAPPIKFSSGRMAFSHTSGLSKTDYYGNVYYGGESARGRISTFYDIWREADGSVKFAQTHYEREIKTGTHFTHANSDGTFSFWDSEQITQFDSWTSERIVTENPPLLSELLLNGAAGRSISPFDVLSAVPEPGYALPTFDELAGWATVDMVAVPSFSAEDLKQPWRDALVTIAPVDTSMMLLPQLKAA